MNPRRYCAGCYNHRMIDRKCKDTINKKQPQESPEISRKFKEETNICNQQEIEKKKLMREALSSGQPSGHNRHTITQKITYD